MPGLMRAIDEVAGLTAITTHEISQRSPAHASAVFLVEVDDIAGRWNVVLELRINGRTLEIGRIVGVQGQGLYAFTLTPPLDRAPAPVLEPNFVRYFTTSPDARFSGRVLLVEAV